MVMLNQSIRFLVSLFLSLLLMSLTSFYGLAQTNERQNKATTLQVSRTVLDNSSLRRHFRDEYLANDYFRAKISFNSARRQRIAPALLEQLIDEEIIIRSEEIAERLNNLIKSYPIAVALLEGVEKEPDRKDLKQKARLFFRDFRNETKKLRGNIDFMISGLPSKPKNEAIEKSIVRKTPNEKLSLLELELDEAERLIMNYFFIPPVHTVTVNNLNNNNMMIRLYHIEKILASIEKAI